MKTMNIWPPETIAYVELSKLRKNVSWLKLECPKEHQLHKQQPPNR